MQFGWINLWGALVVIIMLVPNIIYAVKKTHMENKCKCKSIPINFLEQFGRYACMALMVLPILIWEFGFSSVLEMFLYFGGTGLLLLAYLIVWLFYFKSRSTGRAIALAVLPTMLFFISGILLRHRLLIIASVLFGIGHIYVTIQNLEDN